MDLQLALKIITKSANAKEVNTFHNWLNESEENRTQFEKFESEWNKLNAAVNSYKPDVQMAWDKFDEKNPVIPSKEPQNRTRRMFNWKPVAAAILLLLGSIFIIYQTDLIEFKPQFTQYNAIDTVRTITLEDGTKIWLNTNSELTVPKWKTKGERIVTLNGEAFFEVTHNSQRPFLVRTKYSTTQVLGTSFNVNSVSNEDVVTLFTGKIKFICNELKDKNYILKPGERISYNTDNKEVNKSKCLNKSFIAWKTGELNFKETPLPKVLDKLCDYYSVKISYDPAVTKNQTLTANLTNLPIERITTIIELTLNAKFISQCDSLVLQLNQ